ncbi:MAG: cobalamin-binding protein [Agarilytica sp.]
MSIFKSPQRLGLALIVFFFSNVTWSESKHNGPDAPAIAQRNESEDIVVRDFLGNEVRVKKPVKRIVALAPHIVENLFSAGAGNLVVGAVDYSDYPEAANKIPRVGAISAYSLEAIVALAPDLVVVWRSGHGGKVMEKLIELGLVVYASDPRVVNDVAKSIRDFGRLAGTEEVAEKEASAFEKRIAGLRKRYANRLPVSAFYQVWNSPIQTINNDHIISNTISLCGGENAFGAEIALAPKLSIESVIERNPAAIIASGMQDKRPDWLNDWRKWKNIDAVANDHLFYIPPDIIQRHTVRIADGAQLMCEHLDSARN